MTGRTLGHYQILEKLGEGGMSEVYRARDLKLDRTVALKFIRPDLLGDPDMLRRFQTEARALAALDHPHVGTVHGFEEHQGQHFMVLAFVEGRSLEEILRDGPLSPERAAVLLPRIAEGLQAAHARGVVHRDVKSSNILVDSADVPRLVDFGLALRAEDTRVTRTGEGMVGTLAYMAPELLRGESADARSDIFSLGVVIYQALTGRLPFQESQPAAILHSILNEDPPAFPETLPPEIRKLEPVARRCLEKDRERRYANCGEVASALRSGATAAGRTLPMTRASRKARWPAVALAAVAVGLAAVGAWRWLPHRPSGGGAQFRPRSVAVLDFENVSGDRSLDWMGRGIAELLNTAFSRSEELDVYDAQRLGNLPGTAGGSSEQQGTLGSLKRLGIVRAVVGSIVRSGGRLRIQGRVIEVESGRVLHSSSVEGAAGGDLFQLAGGLIQGLQTALEVDLIGLKTGDRWLRDITTSSVDAYRLFLDGRKAFLGSRWAEAAREYEQALALDSTFAAARIDLTGCYWNLDNGPALKASLAAAGRLRGRTGRRDALQLDLIEAVVNSQPERIIQVTTELMELYPENRFFAYLRGRGYYTSKRYRECLAILEPLARQRYEWAWTYLLIAWSHAHLNQDAEARQAFRLGMEVTHANPEIAYNFAKYLQEHGDDAQAHILLAKAERSPELSQTPEFDWAIRVEMGKIYAKAGRTDSARAEYSRVLKLAPSGSEESRAALAGLKHLDRQ